MRVSCVESIFFSAKVGKVFDKKNLVVNQLSDTHFDGESTFNNHFYNLFLIELHKSTIIIIIVN